MKLILIYFCQINNQRESNFGDFASKYDSLELGLVHVLGTNIVAWSLQGLLSPALSGENVWRGQTVYMRVLSHKL